MQRAPLLLCWQPPTVAPKVWLLSAASWASGWCRIPTESASTAHLLAGCVLISAPHVQNSWNRKWSSMYSVNWALKELSWYWPAEGKPCPRCTTLFFIPSKFHCGLESRALWDTKRITSHLYRRSASVGEGVGPRTWSSRTDGAAVSRCAGMMKKNMVV